VVGAVLDEVCYWRSEDAANPDHEIVTALRPAMVTVPGALLVAISSPYARRGIAWDMFKRHHGPQGDPAILTWQAASRVMNATIPEGIVAEALEQDESAARAEWLAEWRRDVEAFVSREVLDSCVVPGREGLPPCGDQFAYHGFVDPSGGSQDAMTLAIAHAEERDGQVVAVLDHVSERRRRSRPRRWSRSSPPRCGSTASTRCAATATGGVATGALPGARDRLHAVGADAGGGVRGVLAAVDVGARGVARPPAAPGAVPRLGTPDLAGRAGQHRPRAGRAR
jgi:hypothetical protein